MILRKGIFSIACIAAAFSASSAHADVLEIGEDGEARWVAGGEVAAPEGVIVPVEEVPADALAFLPEHAIADTRRHAAGIPANYAQAVADLAHRFDLSPALLEAVVWQESRWRANAISPVGARGLAQLMPGTAREMGVDPDDPLANLEGGARYLRQQLDRFDGNLELALAAYNAGPGRVIRSGGVPNIRETRQYVAAIIGRLANHSRH